MKKTLLFFLIAFLSHSIIAQVVFCPAGAEWRYAQSAPFGSYNISNVRIKYMRDSMMNQVSYKVLQHPYFFGDKCGKSDAKVTLIKQNGDTIFFRNQNTNHTWQILYNYAALTGQSWTTTIYESTVPTKIFTITVQLVSTVTINALPLRKLDVLTAYPSITGSGTFVVTYSSTVTERIGSNGCLFNYRNSMFGACDVGDFAGNLCYQDDAFGTLQYSPARGCDYTFVGIRELELNNTLVDIYPNPGNSLLSIRIEKPATTKNDFRIANAMGQLQEVGVKETLPSNYQLDIQDLPVGIYHLQVFEQGKLFAVKKFVKM